MGPADWKVRELESSPPIIIRISSLAGSTSIVLSPSGDFLCTTHIDDLGIYLWSNRTLYSHVSLRPLPSNHTPSTLALPHTAVSYEEEEEDKLQENNRDGTNADATFDPTTANSNLVPDMETSLDPQESEAPTLTPPPLSSGLVTLSSLPKSHWHSLQHLDVIKRHNKPREPPKQPKQAPFFLPMLPGLQVAAEGDGGIVGAVGELNGAESRILNLVALVPLSEFQRTLQHSASTGECDDTNH